MRTGLRLAGFLIALEFLYQLFFTYSDIPFIYRLPHVVFAVGVIAWVFIVTNDSQFRLRGKSEK